MLLNTDALMQDSILESRKFQKNPVERERQLLYVNFTHNEGNLLQVLLTNYIHSTVRIDSLVPAELPVIETQM